MSKIEVNAIEPQCGTTLTVGAAGTTVAVPSNVVKSNALQAADAGNIISQSGTTITLGASGDSINLASGATQSGFGRTGTVDWDTTPKTGTFTAVSGVGYFVNTTSGAITVTLPASPSAGDIVSLSDYTNTWQTNYVTVARNGSPIGGVSADAILSTEGQSVTFVYVDATEGWKNVQDSTSNVTGQSFICASVSGACNTLVTAPCCANTKIATFTGPGNFTVNNISSTPANNQVSYLVVAGGAGGAVRHGGGGGAGGFREFKSPVTPYTASPLEGSTPITVTTTTFPITVGGGGPAASNSPGSNSTFSTITSAGGGGGSEGGQGDAGGSGGGGGGAVPGPVGTAYGGAGNTPSVSPAQGFGGGDNTQQYNGGGGGGASADGGSPTPGNAGAGGAGVASSISASSVTRAGGGGGGSFANQGAPKPGGIGGSGGGGAGASGQPPYGGGISGTANTGGGGGGGGGNDCTPSQPCASGAGGSGIVIIRYKFQ